MKKTMLTLSFVVTAYILNAQVLYGTTSQGGKNGGGTICKLVTATDTLTAQFNFDAPDGAYPVYLKLLQASDGKLYGMTSRGGSYGAGTIFSYDPADSVYTQLKSFDRTNGGGPQGSLVQASDGKLYGMTRYGGSSNYGVIFSFDPVTSIYTKLVEFDRTNGANPYGSLVQASDGKLYGMTYSGGSNFYYGVIFSYDPVTSAYTKLIDFDRTNGANPYGSLLQASDGKLYGMTYSGGSSIYYGVIFSYDPGSSTFTKLKDLNGTNGANPYGDLVQASDGKLYGMTSAGGTGYGVIFSYNPATLTYIRMKDFDYTNGASPYGGLLQASDGKLYGTTSSGGGDSFGGVIFSYDPVASTYAKLQDFDDANGRRPQGSLVLASDGKLYGVTSGGDDFDYDVIFSYYPVVPTYTKLKDFGTNNTGNSMLGALIKDPSNKLYGMTYAGGSYEAGTFFCYDATISVFTKLKDFDGTNGAFPQGSLMQASDGKLYGMTSEGGSYDSSGSNGVIFSYDPATSTYTKLMDFDGTHGKNPYGGLTQASDGKLYGMTSEGGNNDNGVIFSFDPVTSVYTTLIYFDGTNGSWPKGSLVQASDGKLYGMTYYGGNNDYGVVFSYDPATGELTKLIDFEYYINGYNPSGSLIQAADGKLYGMTSYGGSSFEGVIFTYDPAASAYTKLVDFDGTNGAVPFGSLVKASDGKLYGMTMQGGSSSYGVAFSYDPATSTYTKLNDFNGDNGSYPWYTSFTEITGNNGIQISIADKSVTEGNLDRKFIAVPVMLNEKSEEIIRVRYTTRNNTAKAGSDYIAQSGTLIFPRGLKKILLPVRIIGDETPEATETFSIVLHDPVNATIADSTGIITISDDDASALNATQKDINPIRSISLSPNPAHDRVNVILQGYSGNVVIQLSTSEGRILQQQKLQAITSKFEQQPIDISTYTNGSYLVTVIDEKGNRQTEKLVIRR